MHRKFIYLLTLFAFACAFTSCVDSHEKLIEDEITHLDALTKILNDRAQGITSEADTIRQLNAWAKHAQKLSDRLEKLNKRLSGEEQRKAEEHFTRQSRDSVQSFTSAIYYLKRTDKWTPPIDSALNQAGFSNERFASFYMFTLLPEDYTMPRYIGDR